MEIEATSHGWALYEYTHFWISLAGSGLLTAPNAVPQCHRADEHRRVVFQLIPGDSVTLVNRELRQRILDFAIGPIFRVPGTSIAQRFRTPN